MPITYDFDQKDRLILTKVSGELTTADTVKYFSCLEQDDNCPEDAIEIVDFTNVTDFVLKYNNMKEITGEYQDTKSIKKILATIFICPSPLSFGIGRMLQTIHQITNEKHVVIIVRSEAELERSIKDFRLAHK